jgi:hypothetical protein
LRKSATPSLPGTKLMISMGVPAGGGGGSKSENFHFRCAGDSGDDAHLCNFILFF